MARTIRDSNLETRTARGQLRARGKPYYRAIERGVHLGYRKPLSGAGRWCIRHYRGGETYTVETIATADDYSDADGVAILDFHQAQALARERMVERAHAGAGKVGPVTVADAMDDYLAFLESNRKGAQNAQYQDRAFIRPSLGNIEVAALSTDKLRRWHAELAKMPARVRTGKGETQKHKGVAADDDARRARRATANRTLVILKAALNRAWRDGKTPSDAAWRRVEPFKGVASARLRYLTVAEAQRLINACDPEFRGMVEAALQTGCRYGELARLTVNDFNPDADTVAIQQSKTSRPRHVILTEEGAAFFASVCAGRAGNELMFRKASGYAWTKSTQRGPIMRACERGKIIPPIGFHGLRHTWASLSVMAGMPLLVVAKNLGHTSTSMVQAHYGHLSPSYVVDAIRAGAPRFGIGAPTNVATLSTRKSRARR